MPKPKEDGFEFAHDDGDEFELVADPDERRKRMMEVSFDDLGNGPLLFVSLVSGSNCWRP